MERREEGEEEVAEEEVAEEEEDAVVVEVEVHLQTGDLQGVFASDVDGVGDGR